MGGRGLEIVGLGMGSTDGWIYEAVPLKNVICGYHVG